MKSNLTILDDPLFYVEGLSRLLQQNGFFHHIHHFETREKFYESFLRDPTEYLLIGSHMNSLREILEIIKEIYEKKIKVRIGILGSFFELFEIRKLFEKGVFCYLERNASLDELFTAMDVLKSEEIYICNSTKERMIGFISNQVECCPTKIETLTKREIEVMKLICEGFSSKIISEKLFISINTVETHRKKILLKLNVKNSIGIINYATKNKMLE